MGLDTRAFAKADDAWRERWVEEINEAGERPVFLGLMVEKLTEPVTIDNAPLYHQDGLEDLDWPDGLVGGMLSGNGEGPSFRGKAYTNYVEAMTGRSLYDACHENWQGDVVQEVAARLRRAIDEAPTLGFDDPPRQEREALARWFEVCAEHDLVVAGDY